MSDWLEFRNEIFASIRQASQRVWLLGLEIVLQISSDDQLMRLLETNSGHRLDIKIIIGQPQSNADPYSKEFRDFSYILKQLYGLAKINFEARVLKDRPTSWLIIIDNTAYLEPFLPDQSLLQEIYESALIPPIFPILKFQRDSENFKKVENCFMALWSGPTSDVFSEISKNRAAMETLIEQKDTDEEGKELSILLPSIISYRDLLVKLTAFEVIYTKLCSLIKISTSEHPLQIIRIEYGSLWLKLFGESRVINLLTSLIQAAVIYIYRNYTDEGKLSYIPQKVDLIESVLRLSERLKENGIEISEIKDNVQRSAIIISSQLNCLLLGEPSIKINGKEYSLPPELQSKYLNESKSLQLEQADHDEKS